jgi:uncharacterized cofD-like protein
LKGLRSTLGAIAGSDSTSLAEHLTAIVTMTDDGGSSGRLRRDLGILPPGDVRNCLAALAEAPAPLPDLVQHRIEGGDGLDGHPIGNLMLAALTQMTGDFPAAVEQFSELLRVNGSVLLSTTESVHLKAEFVEGNTVRGETAIVRWGHRIKRLRLERDVRPQPEALRALVNADAIVVGPGSLYTSIMPNLLVGGVASTISALNAVRIYVANLMTEPGETDGYSLDDHLAAIAEHAGSNLFDYVLVNRVPVNEADARAPRGSLPVERDALRSEIGGAHVIERDLAWESDGTRIRHRPSDLADAILDVVSLGRTRHNAPTGWNVPPRHDSSDGNSRSYSTAN